MYKDSISCELNTAITHGSHLQHNENQPPLSVALHVHSSSYKEDGQGDENGVTVAESAAQSPTLQGVDELAEMDDWGSAWQDAKDKGESWGGRGKGGRGIKRNTWQPKDIFVEGEKGTPPAPTISTVVRKSDCNSYKCTSASLRDPTGR